MDISTFMKALFMRSIGESFLICQLGYIALKIQHTKWKRSVPVSYQIWTPWKMDPIVRFKIFCNRKVTPSIELWPPLLIICCSDCNVNITWACMYILHTISIFLVCMYHVKIYNFAFSAVDG